MVIQCGWMTIDSISVINGKATTPAEIVRRIGMVETRSVNLWRVVSISIRSQQKTSLPRGKC